ncbi:MAG: tyrosine-type recombinase/integrase [Caecibacter sp.]|nr:tyrosine-type recombinase/integrase [Caecibacter sp.]
MGLLYKYAIRIELPVKNYAQWTILPEQTASRLHKPFTEREIAILWANTDSKAVRLALIYIYTGLRPTELLRVKTEGVFISERYLRAGMKTKAGKNRVIPIAEKILPFIEELYDENNEYLVIDDRDGKPVRTYDRFRAHYWATDKVLQKMQHLPHDCRHTTATLLSNADVNKKTIQLILGHAARDVTDQVYTHKTISQLIEAINKI